MEERLRVIDRSKEISLAVTSVVSIAVAILVILLSACDNPGESLALRPTTPKAQAPTAILQVTPLAEAPSPTLTMPPAYTNTPLPPTITQSPTHTATSPPSSTATTPPLPTDTMLPTPAPTDTTTPPTATPESVPPQPTAEPSGIAHKVGQPWEQSGMSMNMVRLEVRAQNESQDAAVHAWFRLFNKTGQRLLMEIAWKNIYIEDSQGNRYVDWETNPSTSQWIDPGATYDFDRYYTRRPGERSRVPSDVTYVLAIVDQFARISNVRWQVDINPILVSISPPDPTTVKQVGDAWEHDGLVLTVKKINVSAESESNDSAAHVWFSLTNKSNERRLLEIDYAYFYMLDSQGRRFSDWNGGGIQTQWLDPGQNYDFDRYYSEMSGLRSRITRNADFILIKVDKLSTTTSMQWRMDINR